MADETQNQQNQGAAQGRADATGAANPAPNPQTPPEGDQRAAGDTERDPVDQTDDVQALRHEAASRRRALRAVEKERDTLRERVDTHDRVEVERLVSDGLADASDLWGAVDLDALREDGAVDATKVSEALAGLLERKPHFAKPRDQPNLHQGARQEVLEPPSFGAALKSGGGR